MNTVTATSKRPILRQLGCIEPIVMAPLVVSSIQACPPRSWRLPDLKDGFLA